MPSANDTAFLEVAALVALLRSGPPPHLADLVEDVGSGQALLELEKGLLASELLTAAAADVAEWNERGIRLLTVLDPAYPENLRGVYDRPPVIFVSGELKESDNRAVAIIGSRRASPAGIEHTRAITVALTDAGYTIVSGLAIGIDSAAHRTALDRGARTIGVLGTGVLHSYPPENASLQRQIAARCAVISQFWPDDGPTRKTFPLRNALMSGLSLATVIVEAGARSGARIQARHALSHGRPVLLATSLLGEPWARSLADRPGTQVFATPDDASTIIARLSSTDVPAS